MDCDTRAGSVTVHATLAWKIIPVWYSRRVQKGVIIPGQSDVRVPRVYISCCCTLFLLIEGAGVCSGGAYDISNQNPRWCQKLSIPLCLHTMFGSEYYVYTLLLYVWLWLLCLSHHVWLWLLLICFSHRVWLWLLCFITSCLALITIDMFITPCLALITMFITSCLALITIDMFITPCLALILCLSHDVWLWLLLICLSHHVWLWLLLGMFITPCLALNTMFTHHVWLWLLCLSHHVWLWLLCLSRHVGLWSLFLHTMFGSDYYVYTPYLVLITMFPHHIWLWLLCLHTMFIITMFTHHVWFSLVFISIYSTYSPVIDHTSSLFGSVANTLTRNIMTF